MTEPLSTAPIPLDRGWERPFSKKSDEVMTRLERFIIRNKFKNYSVTFHEGHNTYTIEVPFDL